MSKNNILVIFSDQQRWDSCGCYGQRLPVTPNIDALAAVGVRYENCMTMQPVCGPARACMQTGQYASQNGCHINDIRLPDQADTWMRHLRRAGYTSGYFGKWHLATDKDEDVSYAVEPVPLERRGGWEDRWCAADVLEFTSGPYGGRVFDEHNQPVEFPEDRYRPDVLTDHCVDWLKEQNADQPFVGFLSFLEPHHQNDQGAFIGPKGWAENRFAHYDVPGDLYGQSGDWEKGYADYLACCRALDDNVGRIVAQLKETGLYENTVIIYTSDHGCHFKTRNEEYKRSCHEASIHVPLVMAGPGFSGGRVVSDVVSLIDIPPTILTTAECQIPDSYAGHALQGSERPGDAFVQISEAECGRALRTERWKYAITATDANDPAIADGHARSYTEAYLYDLLNDPHERMNLVNDPAYSVQREQLRDRLQQRMYKIGENSFQIV